MKTDKYIGKKYMSNKWGEVEILSFVRKENKDRYYRVIFKESGNKGVFRLNSIKYGTIRDKERDRGTPSIVGIGYIGDLKGSIKDKNIKPFYRRWSSMLRRVYDINHYNYSSYGGAGVTVDERWHCFATYYQDVQKLEGFNLQEILKGGVALDKDIKQKGKKNRVYSMETCKWVSIAVNNDYRPNVNIKVKAVSPNGDEYIYNSVAKLIEEHNLPREGVYRVVKNGKGATKSLQGWEVYKVD